MQEVTAGATAKVAMHVQGSRRALTCSMRSRHLTCWPGKCRGSGALMRKKHTQQLTKRWSRADATLLVRQVQEHWGSAGRGFMPSMAQTATHREMIVSKG